MSGPSPSADAQARMIRLAVTLFASLALPGLATAQSANQKIQSDIFAARTGLPRSWVVSNKPGVVVAIRDRDSLSARAPGEKIRLQGEVVDDDTAERLGYRSMRSVVEVNCETRRDRVLEMEVFAAPNLKGSGQKRTVPGGWVQPSQDAYMADVIRTACRGAARPADPVVVAEAPPAPLPARAPALIAQAPARGAPAREPISRILQARAELFPSVVDLPPPEPRVPASPEAPITTAPRLPRLAEPSGPARAAPREPAPSPAAPPLAAPSRAQSSGPPPGPVRRAVAGGLTVQVGALDSDAAARRALKSLASLTVAGLVPAVQPIKTGERTFYRALISGFADRADAQAFCAQVARKGGTCLIR